MVGLSLCSCHSLSPSLPNKHTFSFFLVKLKYHLLCESRPSSNSAGPGKAGLPARGPQGAVWPDTIALQDFVSFAWLSPAPTPHLPTVSSQGGAHSESAQSWDRAHAP